jgi:hypothetical protein
VIQRIFLDLDDTLNSFTMFVLGRMGCAVRPYDYHLFPSDCGYDILGAYDKLRGTLPPMTKAQFWNSITREVWAGAPRSPEFDMILAHAEAAVGRENVCILTAPTIDPDCLAGKLEWIHKFLPRWLHRQFLVGPPKHFCARPDTLLIDDSDDKCDKFRESGGQAILVPRPWNSLRTLYTKGYVQSEFNNLFSESTT